MYQRLLDIIVYAFYRMPSILIQTLVGTSVTLAGEGLR